MAESQYAVYRITYEIQGDQTMSEWTCFIGGASVEDALDHLSKTIKKPFRTVSSGMQCRLDDVSLAIRSNVIKRYMMEVGNFVGGAGKPATESRLEEVAIKETADKEAKKVSAAKHKL
jgi:hypothetical protein